MNHALLGTCGRYTIIGPDKSYLCEVRRDDETYDLYEILTVGVKWIGDFHSVERCLEYVEDQYWQREDFLAEHSEQEKAA